MDDLDFVEKTAIALLVIYKDDMVKEGIIPPNVRWDELTQEQKDNVVKFMKKIIKERGNKNEKEN